MKNKKKVTTKKRVQSFGLFLNKNATYIAICAMVAVIMGGTVFATGGVDALWNTVANLLQTWVTRLGGVVMFVGGVMFGIGWMSDDPSRKTSGVQVLIAGAIITAVAALATQFFA